MAMSPAKSKLLHNFPLPYLRWGNQRLLRCMKFAPTNISTQFSPFKYATETPTGKRKLNDNPAGLRPNKLKISALEGVEEELAAAKPWNLRTRRASYKGTQIDWRNDSPVEDGEGVDGKKMGEVKFSVSLSKHEIEEDFVAAVGTRPPRRPKKRARAVQKQLDSVFPGLWLKVTPDAYKVCDPPESAKA